MIFIHEGNGRWRRYDEAKFPALGFDYGAVEAADFDADGAMDLAVASHYRGVIVLMGDGFGTFTAVNDGFNFPVSSREAASFSSRAVTVTDWNGDGRLDVAALSDGPRPPAHPDLGVTVYENLGSAWRPVRAATFDDIFGDAIAAGDVDGDGLADLLTASHTANDRRVLRLGADGALRRREVETLLTPFFVRAVDLADFDNDGRDEMVIGYTAANSGGSLELVSFPSGSRPPQQLWSEPRAAVSALATGDIDGDGAMDVAAALEDGRLLTFRGDARGTVTRDALIEPPSWRRGCSAYAVRLADLDGDNRAEIIATFADEEVAGCPTGGGIEVWTPAPAQSNRRRSVGH